MAAIPESVREFLSTGPLGHVVTLNPDGAPHVTLTWAGLNGDELVMATFYPGQRKVRNMHRDPRVVVSFQANAHEGEGLHPYLVIEGHARISEGNALEVMDRLAEHYIGPGQKFPMRNVPEGAVIQITADRIYGQDPWREDAPAWSASAGYPTSRSIHVRFQASISDSALRRSRPLSLSE